MKWKFGPLCWSVTENKQVGLFYGHLKQITCQAFLVCVPSKLQHMFKNSRVFAPEDGDFLLNKSLQKKVNPQMNKRSCYSKFTRQITLEMCCKYIPMHFYYSDNVSNNEWDKFFVSDVLEVV